MREDQRLAIYTQRLEEWIASTGKTQKELCALTTYFEFGSKYGGIPMSESTLSRTIRTLPFRAEGKYNLYRILGVLYLLDAICDEQEIMGFLDLCDIGDTPKNLSWSDIWKCYIEGKRQYQAQELKLPTSVSTNSLAATGILPMSETPKKGSAHKYRSISLLGTLVVVGIIVFLIGLQNTGERLTLQTDTPPQSTELSETRASFGTIAAFDPGTTCGESILHIEISLTTSTRDTNSNDVIGLVATDSNGLAVVGRLLYFFAPSTFEQTLAVNLNHINSITLRPLTIRLYDTAHAAELNQGISSMDAYRFITNSGVLLAETVVDPADYLPICADLPTLG